MTTRARQRPPKRSPRSRRSIERFRRETIQAVQRFVACMADLARRAVNDEAERALASTGGPGASRPPTTLPHGARPGRPRDNRRIKRTASELAEISARFAAFVETNPGLGIEQINEDFGTTTADLVLPIRRLVAEGVIRPEGRNRATRYFMAVTPPVAPRTANGLEVHPAASGTDELRLALQI